MRFGTLRLLLYAPVDPVCFVRYTLCAAGFVHFAISSYSAVQFVLSLRHL